MIQEHNHPFLVFYDERVDDFHVGLFDTKLNLKES